MDLNPDWVVNGTKVVERAAANRCLVLNEAAQNLIKEAISSIDSEIAELRKEAEPLVSGKLTDSTYTTPKINSICRPFFRTASYDCPPMNEDAQTRLKLKETNVADDLNTTLNRLTQSETIKLLLALVDCYRLSLQRKLTSQIETLTESLTHVEKSFSERQQIFKELQSTEKQLDHSKYILPTALPKQLVNCIASLSTTINETSHWGNKFDQLAIGVKQTESRGPNISMVEWISIFNNAHNVLTDNDWNYISVHVLKGVKSATFCRLYWLHRLRPATGRGLWTADELSKLASAVNVFGSHGKWQEIAGHLNDGRTAFACFKAWHKYLNPQHPSRAPWSSEEDDALKLIVDDEIQHECKALSLVDWGVVSARLQTRSTKSCKQRYAELRCSQQSSALKFSPEEDLSLLMAIQRLGTGGGLYGCGTWSVIAAELPGGQRTAKECELRHNELCEKFQPWTYEETRRLFQFGTRVSETTHKGTGPFITIAILPYFPGRSMSALLNRFRDCKTLASVLKRSRRFPDHSAVTGAFFNSTEFEQVRCHLFGPRTVLGEWVKELQQMGISNPEEYAFSRLLAWKPRQPYQPLPGQKNSFKQEMHHEFTQLLLDLEEGLLLPPKSEVLPATTPSVASVAAESSSAPITSLGVFGVARLINNSQLKPALFSLLSAEIARRMNQPVPEIPSFDLDRGVGKRKVKPSYPKVGLDAQNCLQTAGERLLSERDFFARTFERALSSNETASAAYSGNNSRALELIAPELAGDMLFFAQQDDNENLPLQQKSQPPSTKSISSEKLQRLLRIRQLLLKSRLPSIRSGSLKTPWTLPITEAGRSEPGPSNAPFLSCLPHTVLDQLTDSPSDWVVGPATAMASKCLGVARAPSQRHAEGPLVLLEPDAAGVQLMPPNYATIIALKSLLLNFPELRNTTGAHMSRILHCRKSCNFFNRSSVDNVTLPPIGQLKQVISERPDVAALWSNPKHRIFILRCFALFLWPCLISSMSASSIVDRSLAILREHIFKIGEIDSPPKRLRDLSIPAAIKRGLPVEDDSHGLPVRKRRRRYEKADSHYKLPDLWTQVSVDCDSSITVLCELPSTVEDLVRAGFLPTGFSS
uniref:Myb-like domain-containing protein n=1 Tax=Mesocestoides corti TaxID=53468 RepID=A0A5K3ETG7_MESCO